MSTRSEEPGRALPFHAPPYGPTWTCKDFRRISVVCDIDPAALERFVEHTPFNVTGSRIEIFHDDLGGHSLGAFNESGVCLPIEFEGTHALMHAVIFVTNDVALVAGREVFGYPKLGGEVDYREEGATAYGETRRNGQTIMRVSFEGAGEPCSLDDMATIADEWTGGDWEWTHHLLLKSIPRPDRPGADVYSVVYRNIQAEPTEIIPGTAQLEIADVSELAGLGSATPVAAYLIRGDFGGGWGEDRRVLRTLEGLESAVS
jgi:acetoacetate decarboxylase